MERIEFFLNSCSRLELFTRETRRQLCGFCLDVTADFPVQGEGVPADFNQHTL
jgi:hypothetical protein